MLRQVDRTDEHSACLYRLCIRSWVCITRATQSGRRIRNSVKVEKNLMHQLRCPEPAIRVFYGARKAKETNDRVTAL